MDVLLFTAVVCLMFGSIACWYGRIKRSRLATQPDARATFRMALAMCAYSAFALVLMVLGVHWLLVMTLTAVFVVATTPLYRKLIRSMEEVSEP